MKEWQKRTAMLLGEEAQNLLASSHIAVFGLGGVGSYAVEALARAGVGTLTLVDRDVFAESNINRQLCALPSTVGMPKADVTAARVREINPECRAIPRVAFFLPDNAAEFDFSEYNYVLDCVDNVTAKLALAEACRNAGTPEIAAMGAGNKLHPEMFEICDISKTSVCPLAKVMRRELRLRGINHLKVVFSKEEPQKSRTEEHPVTASVSFVPSVMGLIMAGEAVKDITGINKS